LLHILSLRFKPSVSIASRSQNRLLPLSSRTIGIVCVPEIVSVLKRLAKAAVSL
jgi:hypothetical protein